MEVKQNLKKNFHSENKSINNKFRNMIKSANSVDSSFIEEKIKYFIKE